MFIRCLILCLTLLFAAKTAFALPVEENKRLEELRSLYQKGEMAMREGQFALARDAFRDLIGKHIEKDTDLPTYAEVYLRLAEAENELGNLEDTFACLHHLQPYALPAHLLVRRDVLKARVYQEQKDGGLAYKTLAALASVIPPRHWGRENKAFFQAIGYQRDELYAERKQACESLAAQGDYSQAAILYAALLKEVEAGVFPASYKSQGPLELQLKLAQLHHLLHEPAKALDWLYERVLPFAAKDPKKLHPLEKEALYEAGHAYYCLNNIEAAAGLLRAYLMSDDKEALAHYEKGCTELGLSYFSLKQWAKAERVFQMLLKNGKETDQALAALYLARLALEDKKPDLAEERLAICRFSRNDPLYSSCLQVKGMIAMQQGDLQKAYGFFEQAIANPNFSERESTLRNLGLCALEFAQDPQKQMRAIGCFEELLAKDGKNEELTILLAKALLPYDPKRAHSLLCCREMADCGQEAQRLFLLSELTRNDNEKEAIFASLLSERFAKAAIYAQACLQAGMHAYHFERLEEANRRFQMAYDAASVDKKTKALSLEWLARAKLALGDVDNLKEALTSVDRLLHDPELWQTRQLDSLLYLDGYIALELYKTQAQRDFLQKALNSFYQIVAQFHDSSLAKEALYNIGSIHFLNGEWSQAYENFMLAAEQAEGVPLGADALYFAAQTCSLLGHDPKPLWETLCRNYPYSERAPESAFNCFAFEAYEKGDKEATEHLRKIQTLYPESVYSFAAAYLLALDAQRDKHNATGLLTEPKSAQAASGLYKTALAIYDACASKGLVPDSLKPYCTRLSVKARLDSAYLFLNLEESRAQFDALLSDLPKLAAWLSPEEYSQFTEEAYLGLAQVCLETGAFEKTRKAVDELLAFAHQKKEAPPPYLAQAHYLKGLSYVREQLTQEALKCFCLAEAHGGKEDFLLQVWLAKSDCLCKLKRLDEAMLVLSDAINCSALSPLRLKAMLMRCEIYELQGRHELATKQLEALLTKGGKWAEAAREHLETKEAVR